MNYEFIESPNHGSREGNAIEGIIAHNTAGGSMNGTIKYLCNRIPVPDTENPSNVMVVNERRYYNSMASAHYITDRDGRTVSLVREDKAAWHAGSRTTKPQLNGRGSLNLWTIGHEICNWGALLKRGDKFYTWYANWSHEYKGPKPINSPKKYEFIKNDKSYRLADNTEIFNDGTIEWWEPYTDEQIKSTIVLWKDIVDRYSIKMENIAGHEKVDPTRKIDPGRAFPWQHIFNEIYK